MANGGQLSPDIVSVLMREGTFHGIRSLLASKKISEVQASEIIARSYGAILAEVAEAKKEMKHIQNALERIENICRNGKMSRNSKIGDSNHTMLGNNLVAFDGWVVSLMETVLTITGMLNPEHTRAKISKFATAMNALMDKRVAMNHPVFDDPSLFKSYFEF